MLRKVPEKSYISQSRLTEPTPMYSQSRYRRNTLTLLFSIISVLCCILIFNGIVDPLWCCIPVTGKMFPISPDIQDARLQKTNKLVFGKNDYDALLIGSSRAEQLLKGDFKRNNIFNYSVPSIYPYEISEYITYFRSYASYDPKRVYIGLDFYGTNVTMPDKALTPSYYQATVNTWLYRIKSLCNFGTLRHSLHALKTDNEIFRYEKATNNKLVGRVSQETSDKLVAQQTSYYRDKLYNRVLYQYDPDYRRRLSEIKEACGQARVIVFTTPETDALFTVLLKEGRLSDYERWIRDIVDVFGGTYNFMYPNSMTNRRNNFLDAHHLYPEKASMLVRKIAGEPTDGDPDDIGEYVSAENIEEHLVMVRSRSKKLLQAEPHHSAESK